MDFFNNIATNANTLACGIPHSLAKTDNNLGGNLYFGDTHTYSPKVMDFVMERFCVKSVLDVGSGRGYLPHLIHAKYHVPVIGVEGLPANVEHALFPLVHWDLTKGPFKTSPVDLVTCVEVVEHIEEQYVDNLLDTLTQGNIILMTHAQPGTNGEYHVNEKSDQYWVDKLIARGYGLMPLDTNIVRNIDAREVRGPGYFMKSGLVFGRLPEGQVANADMLKELASKQSDAKSES